MNRKDVKAFWKMTERPKKSLGCWRWKGTLISDGYGYVPKSMRTRIDDTYAHRWSYQLFHGVILVSPSIHVLHYCDHPWCVNPRCLYLGNNKDNRNDYLRKNGGYKEGKIESVKEDVKRLDMKGLSQREIGKELGLCQSTVSRVLTHWRRGDYG
jgi:hypothetical protein